MHLVLPSIQYKDSYLSALKEGEHETGDTLLQRPGVNQAFEAFVQMYHDQKEGKNLPEGFVPATMFWLVEGDKFIGRVQIRHSLTPVLMIQGGHIGYYIRPSARGKGYGRKILELSLPEAKKLGITQALVSCYEDNIASQKIIKQNGGVLQDIVHKQVAGPGICRFWISL